MKQCVEDSVCSLGSRTQNFHWKKVFFSGTCWSINSTLTCFLAGGNPTEEDKFLSSKRKFHVASAKLQGNVCLKKIARSSFWRCNWNSHCLVKWLKYPLLFQAEESITYSYHEHGPKSGLWYNPGLSGDVSTTKNYYAHVSFASLSTIALLEKYRFSWSISIVSVPFGSPPAVT